MATQTDFWGQIQTEGIRTPVAILREQAALLGPKTQNLVEAKVQTHPLGSYLSHSFKLSVPALDYVYQLFSVNHPVDHLYPVEAGGESLADEEQFKTWLRQKLSSPE